MLSINAAAPGSTLSPAQQQQDNLQFTLPYVVICNGCYVQSMLSMRAAAPGSTLSSAEQQHANQWINRSSSGACST
jgi:hypothetical protein